jgi:Uma2 family endonuclease
MDLRPPTGGVLVVPMSRSEFDALPQLHHTEWWDGACVVTGTTRRHGRAITSIAAALITATQGQQLDVLSGTGWRLPSAEFVPDLVVTATAPDSPALLEVPLLIVEVLSASTRHVDRGRKRELYGEAGLPWYWLVDLVANTLVVLRNDGGVFVEVQRVTSGTTHAPISITVAVGDL